jgi:DNA-binding transcriptional ArsR family regulator
MKTETAKRKARIPADRIETAAEVLRVLGHPARLRLAEILDLGGPLAVHAIMEQAGLRQASVSEHLNKMRRAGIIKAIRKGREVWYRIEDPRALTLLNCLRKAGGKS